MLSIRHLVSRLLGEWTLARYRLRAEGPTRPRSKWRRLKTSDDARSVRDGTEVFVFGSREVKKVDAYRLVSALEPTRFPIASGVLLARTQSLRNPVEVAAAGYEIGFARDRPVALPLMNRVPANPAWARSTTISPLAGRHQVAVTIAAVESAFANGWSPCMGTRGLVEAAAERGSCLVVWSVFATPPSDLQPSLDLTQARVVARRNEGVGDVIALTGPNEEGPGDPAPPPSALWIGSIQHARAAGCDRSELRPIIAIRHAATDWAVARQWGDHHFADSLRRALERRRLGSRVIPRHAWLHPFAARDVVITIRGLEPSEPVPQSVNVLWIVSHPDDVTTDELDSHDLVAVASHTDTKRIESMTDTPVVSLLQATDWHRFHRRVLPDPKGLVFVGNSRGVARRAVKWAIEQGLDPWVAGQGWEALLPPGSVVNPSVANRDLPDVFNRAMVVLADHWDDMRDRGYVSNRVFDVLAAGSLVVSDRVQGIADLIPTVPTYDSAEELGKVVRYWLDGARLVARREVIESCQEIIERNHTFDSRVDQLVLALKAHVPGIAKMASFGDSEGPG